MTRLIVIGLITLLAGASTSCDRFPTVVITNDTDMLVIATAIDFANDSSVIAPGESVEMAPLEKKRTVVYLVESELGDTLGCLVVDFERDEGDSADVLVSAVEPCPMN